MKFTTVTKKVAVEIETTPGVFEDYELREMSAATRDQYMDGLIGRMRLDKEGKPAGVSRFDGMQADLLVHTLRKKDGSVVRKDVIQGWPSGTVGGLFAEAQKLNLLNASVAEVTQDAKNV